MYDIQDNPYSTLLGVIRTDSDERKTSSWRLGVIASISPLLVRLGGHLLSGADLRINPSLLGGSRAISISNASSTLGGESVSGELAGTAHWSGMLEPGDQVILLPSDDGQQFIILCKVVNA
ncbi:DUF2577 family protein [Oscillospiraceae bacterium MB08-C2-2]|nr:DUF2577 family protein [Oscillospiraceae bacterium MB08-C2-2]